MIDETWLDIFLFLSMIFAKSTETASCPQSRETVTRVPSCPKSKEEWNLRANIKQCSLVREQCINDGESVYHCVINSFVNETLEVCAPKVRIIGQACVEYNVRGAIVQESPYVNCSNSCPFSYTSTEAYKYQGCYKTIMTRNKTENLNMSSSAKASGNSKVTRCTQSSFSNSSERNWMIIAIILIMSNACFIVWIIYSKKKEMKDGKKEEEEHFLSGSGSCDKNEEEHFLSGSGSCDKNEEEEHFLSGSGSCDKNEEEEHFLSGSGSCDKNDMKKKKRNDTEKNGTKGCYTGKYVAGVDIGDSFLTMALSKKDSPEDVILLGSFERMALLFDGKMIAFGNDAFKQYMESNNKDLRYEEGFKLNDEKIEPYIYETAVSHILKRLHDALDTCKELPENQQPLSHLHYVFVVPTIWSNSAREKLTTEIKDKHKNIDKERLHVIRREQTLSPFIREVNARVLCLKFNVDNLILNPDIRNNSYAILHIGSTCCDLTFLQVVEDRDANNTPEARRHEWKVRPTQYLLNFLVSIYGRSIVDNWKKEYRRDYIKFVYEFERHHKNTTQYTDEKTAFALHLPKSLTSKKEHVQTEEINTKNNKLNITHKFLKECFKEMKDEVSHLIFSEKETFKNVSCVVMTGTYSNMEMVWDKAEDKWFKDMPVTIAVPKNIHVFAMGGAYYVQKEIARNRK